MCEVLDRIDKTKVTGFKVALKKNNRYYSLCTGLNYPKRGLDSIPVITKARRNQVLITDTFEERSSYYHKGMVGRTSVITTIKHAKTYLKELHDLINDHPESVNVTEDAEYVILEMVLGGEIRNGKLLYMETFVGSKIISVKELG